MWDLREMQLEHRPNTNWQVAKINSLGCRGHRWREWFDSCTDVQSDGIESNQTRPLSMCHSKSKINLEYIVRQEHQTCYIRGRNYCFVARICLIMGARRRLDFFRVCVCLCIWLWSSAAPERNSNSPYFKLELPALSTRASTLHQLQQQNSQ